MSLKARVILSRLAHSKIFGTWNCTWKHYVMYQWILNSLTVLRTQTRARGRWIPKQRLFMFCMNFCSCGLSWWGLLFFEWFIILKTGDQAAVLQSLKTTCFMVLCTVPEAVVKSGTWGWIPWLQLTTGRLQTIQEIPYSRWTHLSFISAAHLC